jgi:uncharacterized repeat protein (TIGR01451 family)
VQNNSATNIDGDHLINTVKSYSNGTLDSSHTLTSPISLGSLSGHVWLDTNGNGVFDGSDTNAVGQTVHLLDSTGHDTGLSTSTDANGNYSFKNLVDGSYAVKVDAPSGDEFSPVGTNATAALDSVVNGSGVTPEYVVNAGTNTPNLNAAYYAPAALGDKVFTDFNANGIQDSGDTGIAGLTVTLLDASGHPTDGHGNAVVTTGTTDANGLYHFTDLRPGSYEVQFMTPSGDVFTRQFASGTTTALDSNANPTTGIAPAVTLVSGQVDNTIDAGVYKPVTISGTVFTDLNDNGVQDAHDTGIAGIKVDLYANGINTGQELTTDANGFYDFTGEVPGSAYSVKVINSTPDTFSPKGTGPAAVDSVVDASGASTAKTLLSGDNLPYQNAGLFPPQPKLSINKQESVSTGQAGDIVTYTVTIAENADAVSAFNVTMADLLATLGRDTADVRAALASLASLAGGDFAALDDATAEAAAMRLLAQLGPADDRRPLVEQADQRAQQPGLTLTALAEQNEVVAGDERPLHLRQDSVLEAQDARPDIVTFGQRGEEVLPQFLLDSSFTVACGA